ncbi:hypothetical protein J6590_051891 [Homalodisca vitripennis]|nr:hypothetical protein J6590_051891 [Homalodisca vitripennis]
MDIAFPLPPGVTQARLSLNYFSDKKLDSRDGQRVPSSPWSDSVQTKFELFLCNWSHEMDIAFPLPPGVTQSRLSLNFFSCMLQINDWSHEMDIVFPLPPGVGQNTVQTKFEQGAIFVTGVTK